MNLGLKFATADSISLLGNFEVAATAVIALALFHEKVSKLLWMAIATITVASLLLCFSNGDRLQISWGCIVRYYCDYLLEL